MSNNWTYDETLAALHLYCLLPFGRFRAPTPEIIELATQIGRTPDAVAMKLSNLASFDPFHQARHVKGLQNASKLDKQIFEQFQINPTEMALQGAMAAQKFAGINTVLDPVEVEAVVSGRTEAMRTVPVRLVQGFFRRAVLGSYGGHCAVCGLDVPQILVASHIIPWKDEPSRRADPRNGLALCALHDRLFDSGLLAVKTDFSIALSSTLPTTSKSDFFHTAISQFNGKQIHLPLRFAPDPEALAFHKDKIFQP